MPADSRHVVLLRECLYIYIFFLIFRRANFNLPPNDNGKNLYNSKVFSLAKTIFVRTVLPRTSSHIFSYIYIHNTYLWERDYIRVLMYNLLCGILRKHKATFVRGSFPRRNERDKRTGQTSRAVSIIRRPETANE